MNSPAPACRFYDFYQPWKDRLRHARQALPQEVKNPGERVYAVANIGYYLFKPFVDTCCFYFDVMKDVTFTVLIYTSLRDLVTNLGTNLTPENMKLLYLPPFEEQI